jgi:hypothetical protein
MPRFVVLTHDSPRGLHWDFMLEQEQVLATWALPEPPDADGPLVAQQLADHRLVYLDHEGRISGGRGHVRRWDTGIYQLRSQNEQEWTVLLQGQRLLGEATLRRIPDEASAWEFTFRPIVLSASC